MRMNGRESDKHFEFFGKAPPAEALLWLNDTFHLRIDPIKCFLVKYITSACIPLTRTSHMVSICSCKRGRKCLSDMQEEGTVLHMSQPRFHSVCTFFDSMVNTKIFPVACHFLYLWLLRIYFQIFWKKFSLEVFVILFCKFFGACYIRRIFSPAE